MSDFEFREPAVVSEELRMLRDQARRFVKDVVEPHGEQWERDGLVPRSIFRELGDLGLLGALYPESCGGSELGPMASVVLAEEFSRSSFGGFASSVNVHTDMSLAHIVHRGTEEQQQRYLPAAVAGEKIGAICVTEPHAGSDVAGIKTRAVRDGDDWVINGSKTFITNGVHGDIYIVAARTDPDVKPSRGISLFIVEKGTPDPPSRRTTSIPQDLPTGTRQ